MRKMSIIHNLVLVSALVAFTMGLGFAEENETEVAEEIVAAAGVAISDANWTEEWVEVSNSGEAAQNLTGWSLKDDANHTYTFPEGFVLEAGAAVKVHTETGNDTATDLYWCCGNDVWNNDGDTAYLIDESGLIVSQYPEAEEPVEEPAEDEVVEESTEDEVVEESTEDEVVEESTEDEVVEESTEDEVVEEPAEDEVVEEPAE